MATQDALEFVKRLDELSAKFKADSQARTATYQETLSGQAVEFQQQAHDYAKDMTELADEFVHDVQDIYKDIYGETPNEPPTDPDEA